MSSGNQGRPPSPRPADRRGESGPFDIIGDVHGCCDELEEILRILGYESVPEAWRHPAGRTAVFVGDIVDRGPRNVDALNLVMAMCDAGTALCLPGNHDVRMQQYLRGHAVKIAHGLDTTLAELAGQTAEYRDAVAAFFESLPSHLLLDHGRLVVVHAGLREHWHGQDTPAVTELAVHGEMTGELDEYGLPERIDWWDDYEGAAAVVYGHTPVADAVWIRGTIDIDTGCVYGGKLTALTWPEKQLVSVPARRQYATSIRPFPPRTAELPAG